MIVDPSSGPFSGSALHIQAHMLVHAYDQEIVDGQGLGIGKPPILPRTVPQSTLPLFEGCQVLEE